MTTNKSSAKKRRIVRRINQNGTVPTWVIVRTDRKVRTNPKRRQWRKSRMRP